MQAIRLPGLYGDLLQASRMETSSDRRRRRLAGLVALHGLAAVAQRSHLRREALDQVLKGTLLPPKADGSRSPRALGNASARAIEDAFGLGVGWFDAPDPEEAPAAPAAAGYAAIAADLDVLPDIEREAFRQQLAQRAAVFRAYRDSILKAPEPTKPAASAEPTTASGLSLDFAAKRLTAPPPAPNVRYVRGAKVIENDDPQPPKSQLVIGGIEEVLLKKKRPSKKKAGDS